MSPPVLVFVYCGLIVAASLVGGWLPGVLRLTHRRMQVVMSAVAGLMLGVALFHLLPHGLAELGGSEQIDRAMLWVMVGLLAMFFLVRAFHFHQHAPAEEAEAEQSGADQAGCDHSHPHPHHVHNHNGNKRLSWVGVLFGLSLHTAIDGIALAATVAAESRDGQVHLLAGLGVFLAIVLHKPLDSMSITALMRSGGWEKQGRLAVNLVFAAMCPLGAVLFWLGAASMSEQQHHLVGSALAFSAGVFLCISLGDLLPEVQFHTHDRLLLSAALLLGVVAAWAIGFLEPPHVHGHPLDPEHRHFHSSEGIDWEAGHAGGTRRRAAPGFVFGPIDIPPGRQ